jgi:hypothetical protein
VGYRQTGIPIDRVIRTAEVLHVADMREDPSYLAETPASSPSSIPPARARSRVFRCWRTAR